MVTSRRRLLVPAVGLAIIGLRLQLTSDNNTTYIEGGHRQLSATKPLTRRNRRLRKARHKRRLAQSPRLVEEALPPPQVEEARPRPPLFSSQAQRCSSLGGRVYDLIPDELFHSQHTGNEEDRKLMAWFSNICNGSYIEMGALADGITFSNSYVFSKALGWTGVLIELISYNYEKLVINRPNDITINSGVCDDKKQTLQYVTGANPAVGGISVGRKLNVDDPNVKEIQCDRLDSILLDYTPHQMYWDFFSLDVEGAELSILQSLDLERVGFGIIFVKVDHHSVKKNEAIRELLLEKGYVHLKKYSVRNDWFIHPRFNEIYGDILGYNALNFAKYVM